MDINALSSLVKFFIDLINDVDKKFSDGKLSLLEKLELAFSLAKEAPELWAERKELGEEIKALDSAEIDALIEIVKNDLQLDPGKAKTIVQDALDLIVAAKKLVVDIKG
jgi:hypothetical protein